jgi:hypothetical protein
MGTRRHRRWIFFVLAAVVVLPALATAHGPEGQASAPAPFDPELFTGWQTWVHLSVQWGHLLSLPLWLGVLVAAWVFRVVALETLLFGGWAVLLLQGVTGAYNMEYGAGIPTAPSLLQWPMVGAYDFGQSYTALLGVKQGLYGLAVLVIVFVTAVHLLRAREADRTRLRRGYLAAQIVLGVL